MLIIFYYVSEIVRFIGYYLRHIAEFSQIKNLQKYSMQKILAFNKKLSFNVLIRNLIKIVFILQ